MKVVIPWVCVFALLVGCFFLYATTKEDQKELAQLRVDGAEMERLRKENGDLKQLQVNNDELVRLRNEHEELLRLRGEVGQLRKQNKTLTSELQTARAQSSAAMQQQHQSTELATENKTLRNRFEQLQKDQAQARVDVCIKNLQRIDDTKVLWAKETQKPPGSLPTATDLAPYFPNNTFPVCPEGGVYTINPLGIAPTCSIPGHALPKP